MLISRDVELVYINDAGITISLSRFGMFHLWDCREQMENAISSEKVMRTDGEMFTYMSKEPRYLEISGFIDAVAGRRQLEGQLKQAFNTGIAGTLEYFHRMDNRRYTIRCYVESTPSVVWNNARVEFNVHLKCLDPFWYGAEITHAIPSAGLTFNNIGDSVAGFVVTLTGSASQPFIASGHDERLTFMGNLTSQTLIITSMPDRSMVTRNNTNAMQFLTNRWQRNFFLLGIGSNTVNFGAAAGASGLTAILSYRPRHLGTF